MGERRIINGAIYEKTPEGIVLVGPAPAASLAPTAIPLPVNPVRAAREAQEDARKVRDQQLQEENAVRAERAADRADRTANRQIDTAAAAAAKADKPTELQSKSAGFLGRMVQSEAAFNAVPSSERGPRGLLREKFRNIAPVLENEFLNSPDRQKADQAVKNFIAASLRQESGAAIGQEEFDRQYDIFFPSPGDSEEVIAQKAAARQQAIEGFRIAAGPLADKIENVAEQKADNEVPGAANGADTKPALPATGDDTRFEPDDRMKSKIDSLISAGSFETANAVLRKANLPPISPGEKAKIIQWQKANPGKAYNASKVGREVPLTAFQSLAGSPLGAGAARFANSATAGLVGAVAGEKGKGALDAMAAANPKSALAGDVVGGVLGALGAEAGAAAALGGRGAAWLAPRLGDAAYGGLSGVNAAQEGQGAEGAMWGAGAGVLGGALGQFGANQVGRLARGVSDPDVRALRDAGVPLTVGRVVGNTGPVGKMIRGTEDRLTGFPLVGDAVNARNTEGVEAFAERMANDAVAPINGNATGYGQQTVDSMLQQGSDAYTAATNGVTVPLDPQFGVDMQQVRALGGILPDDLSARFGKAIDNRVGPVEQDGYLTGDSFQQSLRGLKSYRAEATKPGFEQDYREALSGGIDALRGQMTRGGGQDVVDNLANADQAWKQIKVVQKATEAARNGARSGEVGLPMPSQFNDAALAASNKYGGPRFNGDLIDSAQRILPSKVGDSGTAGRLGVGMLLAGGAGLGGAGGADAGALGVAGGATAGGLGTALLLAAGGSRFAQKQLTDALLNRPDLAVELGTALSRNSRYGGVLGAATTTPLAIGQ